MADEASVRSSLNIDKGNVSYRSNPTRFLADVGVEAGPSPGKITVTQEGVDVDLSEVTTPGGFCWVQNQDTVSSSTNFVEAGIWDGSTFYPLMELLQGEAYVFRLARNLTEEYGTGTGTTGASVNTFRLKSYNASVPVTVHAFSK